MKWAAAGATVFPAFRAYNSTGYTLLTSGTVTKVTYPNEDWDTNNNFASSRFTPTVAGYYFLNALGYYSNTSAGFGLMQICKNGSAWAQGGTGTLNNSYGFAGVASTVYANGTSDYFEVYIRVAGGTCAYEGSTNVIAVFEGIGVKS
jgi:hypothetical protein